MAVVLEFDSHRGDILNLFEKNAKKRMKMLRAPVLVLEFDSHRSVVKFSNIFAKHAQKGSTAESA